MKTHISNTKAKQLYLDVMGKTVYEKHQNKINSDQVKPCVVTRRKEQIKINNNNKKQINQNPNQHVNHLFKNLHQNKYKSSIDNHAKNYQSGKKLLKDKIKKNRYENAAKKQHQRELEVQSTKIKNCKTITQRKKDKTDPIVNPTYFMRDNHHANSVTIQSYKNKILKKNRPVSGHINKYQSIHTFQISGQPTSFQNMQGGNHSFGNVPNYAKPPNQRPASAKYPSKQMKQNKYAQNDDLPQCTFKALLNHIVQNKLWKDTDMKVLYVRLCHRYGQQKVDDVWDMLMDELEK